MGLPEWFRRFWAKVIVRPWDCWEWTASLRKDGYGRFALNGGPQLSHLVAYRFLVGSVPEGLKLDHLCRNRKCVNPEHLEPVTDKENVRRGDGLAAINARKVACPNGHPLEEGNLYVSAGKRRCKVCTKANSVRKYYEKKGQG